MTEIALSFDLLLLLFMVGMLAGGIDAIAGGGGLIALPALLSVGLTPPQALATNKLQGSFGTFSATVHFLRHGLVELKSMRLQIGCTFVGAVSGTLMVQFISTGLLRQLIPFLLIIIALYFLLSPKLTDQKQPAKISESMFAVWVGFSVGFYDGFFGPGTGSLFAVAFVTLLGYGLTAATARTKVLNLTSNLASLLIFALHGDVLWTIGIIMGVGQLVGARAGAHLVVRKGGKFIKPVIVVVTILISIKLLLPEL